MERLVRYLAFDGTGVRCDFGLHFDVPSPSPLARHCQARIGEFLFPCSLGPYAHTVILSKRSTSSRWILTGFALLALSSLLTFYNLTSEGYLSQSGFKDEAQLLLSTMAALFAAGGWWFLCQIVAKDSAQKVLLTKADVLLGLQFSASCIGLLFSSGPAIRMNRFSAPYWINALGFAVGAGGFFLASYRLNKLDLTTGDS